MLNSLTNPKFIFKLLLFNLLFLVTANCLVLFLRFQYLTRDHTYVTLFNFNREANIPTFYSSILLFTIAVFLLFLGVLSKKDSDNKHFYWIVLSFAFLFISIDETVKIHEAINGLLSDFTNASGYLFYVWVVPYGLLALGFAALYYFKFIRYLPSKTKNLFMISLVIFLSGAIGCEILGAKLVSTVGSENILYTALFTLEETLEILGASIFLYALVLYFQQNYIVYIQNKNSQF